MKYTKNRFLRIIPAFWLSLGISAFVLVPIISNTVKIFSFDGVGGSSIEFFLKSASFHIFGYAWTITGAFPTNPMIDGINGSMWTLKHEMALYFILPFIVWLTDGKKSFLLAFLVAFLILAFANILTGFILFSLPCCRGWVLTSNEYSSFITFAAYFFTGVVIYKFKEYVVVTKKIIFFCSILVYIGYVFW